MNDKARKEYVQGRPQRAAQKRSLIVSRIPPWKRHKKRKIAGRPDRSRPVRNG